MPIVVLLVLKVMLPLLAIVKFGAICNYYRTGVKNVNGAVTVLLALALFNVSKLVLYR